MGKKKPKTETETTEDAERRDYQRDERDPAVIWAERFNTEARIMDTRFKRLIALGNAKRAKPTQKQLDEAVAWLQSNVNGVVEALGRKLKQPELTAPRPKPENFMIVSGAPARAAPKAKPKEPASE